MERIHLKHKGLKKMEVCEFNVGEGPLHGKKVTPGEWHFLALTVSPKVPQPLFRLVPRPPPHTPSTRWAEGIKWCCRWMA